MKQRVTKLCAVSMLWAAMLTPAHAQDAPQTHRPGHNTDLIDNSGPRPHADFELARGAVKQHENKGDIFAIAHILEAQVQEWNKGNIEGFMHGYWESDSLVFIGSKGPRHGYDSTLKRYKEAYPDADHMGHLKSTVTSIQRLSDEYYFVIGRWALTRKAGDVDGSYTLLIRKIKGQWVIVCDHSS